MSSQYVKDKGRVEAISGNSFSPGQRAWKFIPDVTAGATNGLLSTVSSNTQVKALNYFTAFLGVGLLVGDTIECTVKKDANTVTYLKLGVRTKADGTVPSSGVATVVISEVDIDVLA